MDNNEKFYIDGVWVDPVTPHVHDVINPATEETTGRISLGSAADIDLAVKAARRAFPAFSRTTREQRLALLQAIIRTYESRIDDLAGLITREMGSPLWFAKSVQAETALAHFKEAAKVLKEYDTPDWSPDKAQDEMTQALTALGNHVDGVYAANDGTAGGAIAAMKAAGIAPLPPITGQDAELAAIQRIVLGEQYMTVYKAIAPEAEAAAVLAYHLASGTPVPPELARGRVVNNGKKNVPAVLLAPVAVTRDNVKSTIVADAFWTKEQICTAPYAAACRALGIL